jgi:hypothetical protein
MTATAGGLKGMPVSPGLTLNELCTRSVIQKYTALTTTLIPPVSPPWTISRTVCHHYAVCI